MVAGTKVDAPLKLRVYVGPKDLALLSKVQPSLEALINFRAGRDYREAAALPCCRNGCTGTFRIMAGPSFCSRWR